MSAYKRRKVEQVITNTYHSLPCCEECNKGRTLQKNVTVIANLSKIQ
jgi:hypothetical protein